jgi:plastocyanin
MTTPDENHITRTSPKRFAKGLVMIIIPLIFVGYLTVFHWHDTASVPPPVSAPPPAPPATTDTEQTRGSDSGGASAPAAASGTAISIPAGAATAGNPPYEPDKITVSKGDVITVTNNDNAPHTATSGTGPEDPNSAKLFDTSLIMAGESAKIDTATLEAGDYDFHCTVHPFMKGSITVQ